MENKIPTPLTVKEIVESVEAGEAQLKRIKALNKTEAKSVEKKPFERKPHLTQRPFVQSEGLRQLQKDLRNRKPSFKNR